MKTIKTFFYNLKLQLYTTWLRKLYLYLKYRKEIDNHYGYAIKHGSDYGLYCNEEAGALERTDYWLRSI